jgi:hypothetical protein
MMVFGLPGTEFSERASFQAALSLPCGLSDGKTLKRKTGRDIRREMPLRTPASETISSVLQIFQRPNGKTPACVRC